MVMFYRVVRTKWSYKDARMKTTDSLGFGYRTVAEAEEAMKNDVFRQLNYLNEGRDSIDFRHSFTGDFDCIIRFWDGQNDYRDVMGHDIHSVSTDNSDYTQSTYYKYRGFIVIPNEKHTSFAVKDVNGTVMSRKRKLENALWWVDNFYTQRDTRI